MSRGGMAVNSNCFSNGGQFKATHIWNILIQHLQENASVKRRRNTKKSTDNCFTGANAVDVLHQFVKCHPEQFKHSVSVPRENIVRLCQSFIDMGVIKDVENDWENGDGFEDSSTAFYAFIDPDSNTSDIKSVDQRQALREIDGEIRNSLGHISISSDQNSRGMRPRSATLTLTKTSSTPMRNKLGNHRRVPSFSGIAAQTKKGSFKARQSNISDAESVEGRPERRLKRTPSLVGIVLKRSSSENSLSKDFSSTSSASDSEYNENTSNKMRNNVPKFRLSQHLSFRRKSTRKSEHVPKINESYVISNPLLKDREPQARTLTSKELAHVERECIRVRLLQILDMPFVDDVITSPAIEKKVVGAETIPDGASSSSHGVQYSEVVASYNSEDSWISSALIMLQRLPNGYDILRVHARESSYTKKVKLFDAISDHYKAFTKPLVDETQMEIITAIIRLLEKRPVSESLEALQLFYNLLPDQTILEINQLTTFLNAVASTREVTLSSKCNNKMVVLKNFSSAIFPVQESSTTFDANSGLSGLLRFTLEHSSQVFKLPEEVLATVQRKRALLEAGKVDSPSLVIDSSFCSMITTGEYDKQRVEFTQKQLSELAHFILKDESFSGRKKKNFLKKLQASHPDVYEKSQKPFKATLQIPIVDDQQILSKPVVRSAPASATFMRKRPKSYAPGDV